MVKGQSRRLSSRRCQNCAAESLRKTTQLKGNGSNQNNPKLVKKLVLVSKKKSSDSIFQRISAKNRNTTTM